MRTVFLGRSRPLIVSLLATTVLISLPSLGSSAASSQLRLDTGRKQLQPAEHLPTSSVLLAPVAPSTQISGAMALRPRNPLALASYARSVSTAGSASFHRFLAPGQFRSVFGPDQVSIQAATSALGAAGLATTVSGNGLLLSFRGPAASVDAAFHTSLATVRLASGRIATAPVAPISVPLAIASSVAGVVGLSDVVRRAPSVIRAHGSLSALASSLTPSVPASIPGAPTACAAASGAATQYGGLTDRQIAHAYGADGLYRQGALGGGQRVALFELEPFLMSDLSAFTSCYLGAAAASGLASRVAVHPVLGGVPQGAGSGEATLDIENILALSPQAGVDVYEGPNTSAGVLMTYNQIVQDDAAKVISSSWGLCEALSNTGSPGVTAIENSIFEQAAVQGQTVFASAGDYGSSDCSPTQAGLAVDDPASQPYVIGVGGTTIQNPSNPPTETTWNDGAHWGGTGGGLSDVWSQPSWQLSSKVPGISTSNQLAAAASVAAHQLLDHGGGFCSGQPAGASDAYESSCRQVPDVSAQADEFTGAITVYLGGWTTIGGTSSATPIWAALLADAASTPSCSSGGGPGFIGPALYAIASNPATYAQGFNDVSLGNNDAMGSNAGLFAASAGYDMASGLGSPKMTGPQGEPGLAALLCNSSSLQTPLVSSVSPTQIDPAGQVTAVVTGSGFEQSGLPVVASVQLGTLHLVPGPTSAGTPAFTVDSATQLTVTVPPASFQVPTGTVGDPSASTTPYGPGRYALSVTSSAGLTSPLSAGSLLLYAPSNGLHILPVVIGIDSPGGSEIGGSTVTVIGAGFADATSVSFGGVPSPAISVQSASQLQAVVPAMSSGGGASCATATDPATDICQVHVVVGTAHGSSAPSPILLPSAVPGQLSPGCGCELAPGADEFDYFPAPQVSSSVIVGDPAGFAGEGGGSQLLVTGVGFDPFGFIAPVMGDARLASSYLSGATILSPTQLLVTLPGFQSSSTGQVPSSISIETLASPNIDAVATSTTPPSNPATFTYTGLPSLSSISTKQGPTIGGTAVTITGSGLLATDEISFDGIPLWSISFPGSSQVSSFDSVSDASLSLHSPGALPGPYGVMACNATGCSAQSLRFHYYPPGDASISSISSASGPAGGGTVLEISGTNLSCAQLVRFGAVVVRARRLPAITGCGDPTKIKLLIPPGRSGSSVAIRVLTLEGSASSVGYQPSVATLRYRYR